MTITLFSIVKINKVAYSSMLTSRSLYGPRFNILKPNSTITSMRHHFTSKQNQSYEVAEKNDFSVRKYFRTCDHLQKILSIAEWRFSAPKQIVHCYYVELKKPKKDGTAISIQVYVENMQISLKNIEKLITSQALYMLLQSLKGSKLLLETFKKVSINQQTIGLNSTGQCVVWINRQLEADTCEQLSQNNQLSAMKTIIQALRCKCQTASKNILTNIQDYIEKQKPSIENLISYVTNIVSLVNVVLPKNLKYLVNQARLKKQAFKYKENVAPKRQSSFKSNKKFTFSGAKLKEANLNSPQTFKSRRGSYFNEDLTKNIQNKLLSPNTCHHLQQLSRDKGQRKITLFQDPSRFTFLLFNGQQQLNKHNISSNQKHPKRINSILNSQQTLTTRCKSFNNELSRLTTLHNFKTNNSIDKNFSRSKNEQTSQKVSGISKITTTHSHSSSIKESALFSKEPLMLNSLKMIVTKSQMNNTNTNRYLEQAPKIIQDESFESSIETDNLLNSIPCKKVNESVSNSTELNENHAKNIFQQNKWSKKLDGLFENIGDVQASYIQGQQDNIYLQDVKLEKLNLLGGTMMFSCIPGQTQ